MARRQRLLVEDVERRAPDHAGGEGLHHGRLVDHRAAADVDHHGGRLHGGERRRPDHPARLWCEWCSRDDIVASRDHLHELGGAVDAADQRVQVVNGRASAVHGEDLHAHSPDACGHGASDVAVADNSNGLAGDFGDVELLPDAGFLVAHHAAQVLGEKEDGSQRELAQRLAEDPASIGERHRACHQLGE